MCRRLETKDIKRIVSDSGNTVMGLAAKAGHLKSLGDALVAVIIGQGGKILTAGNGGSAAEALHMAEELVGRYRGNRRPIAAVSLVADTTALTCIGNDYGFDEIFSRQVQALGREQDALVLFSTSGSAANLSLALEAANAQGMTTVCILGRDGGPLAGRADHEIIVDSQATERIQEVHQVIVHLILEMMEEAVAQESA